MKKIKNVNEELKKPTPTSQLMKYREAFISCLNTMNTQGMSPYDSTKILALSIKLMEYTDEEWIVEESEYDLIKKSVEQNTIGFFGFIQGQLLNRLGEAEELKIK